MVKVYAARTLPVNPPEASFILKKELLWIALKKKIRRATEFVPAMKDCKVVKDENDIVIRDCLLELPNKQLRKMREEVTTHGDQWIIFRQGDGSSTMNFISHGVIESDENLQLSYVFEWNYDVDPDTPEHKQATEMTDKMAIMAVKASIDQARKLVQDGIIKEVQ